MNSNTGQIPVRNISCVLILGQQIWRRLEAQIIAG